MLEHCRESVKRCVEEDKEVCRPSQGHAAVELLDLVLEELLQLWSLCFQCRRQKPILNGEHLLMDVDVLHLEEEKIGVWKGHIFRIDEKKVMPSVYLLKRVEAIGFAQTHQIFQDHLL